MELNTAKALAMLSLGLGSFIFGMLPAWFSPGARQRSPLLLSSLLCFGGGVLLATSLIHMLPEARMMLPDYAELALCLGFFLVYFVDEVVHLFQGKEANVPEDRALPGFPHYGSGEGTSLLRPSAPPRQDDELAAGCGGGSGPRMCHVSHKEPCRRSASGRLGLLAGLLLHSVLEGLAIGLQTDASKVLLLLGAVASHKLVVGFCLGVELADSSRLCTHLLSVVVFSLGSAGGIGLGTLLEDMRSVSESAAMPALQALAAGTLLYVTVSEVLPRERARWHERARGAGVAQFLAVGAGFTLMYLLTAYLEHEESP